MTSFKELFTGKKQDKQEELVNETFASKQAKEASKRRHKIMYIGAAVLMAAGTAAGIGGSFLNHMHMNQKTNLANSKNNNDAAKAILKNGKGVRISSDKDEANSRLAKAKKEAQEARDAAEGIANAKAAKRYADQEKGKIISTKKSKQLIEKAVNDQIKKDKKVNDKLQDKIDDLKAANEKLAKAKDSGDSADIKAAKKQIKDYQDQVNSYKTSAERYKNQADAYKNDNERMQTELNRLRSQVQSKGKE